MTRQAQTFLYIDSHVFRRVSLGRLAIAAGQQALDLGGSAKDPLKEAPGKVAVLIFVRTDCPISNRYAPLLQEMSVKYGREAAFWLVFPDKNE